MGAGWKPLTVANAMKYPRSNPLAISNLTLQLVIQMFVKAKDLFWDVIRKIILSTLFITLIGTCVLQNFCFYLDKFIAYIRVLNDVVCLSTMKI